jgi:hypothetical protein
MKMKSNSNQQRPIVGGIYRDKSGSSLVVLNVIGDKVLLEYANGTVTSVTAWHWQQLHPKNSVYYADSTTREDPSNVVEKETKRKVRY